MLITPDYLKQNAILHRERADYGSKIMPARIDQIAAFKKKLKAKSILDYGCGKGVLSGFIGGVRNYDPCIPKFATAPTAADLVVCVDVLEHVEHECLVDVLDHIRGLSVLGVFLIIGTRLDSTKLLPDGRNPHRIVERAEWWLPILRERWRVIDGWFTAGELGVRAVVS